jgi:hypothetical protein
MMDGQLGDALIKEAMACNELGQILSRRHPSQSSSEVEDVVEPTIGTAYPHFLRSLPKMRLVASWKC